MAGERSPLLPTTVAGMAAVQRPEQYGDGAFALSAGSPPLTPLLDENGRKRRTRSFELDARLVAAEASSNEAMCRRVEKRLSSLRSQAVVGALLFGFSTSVLALGPDTFNSTVTRHRFVALLSVTVVLSAFSLLTYLLHSSVCDHLVAEGLPEYAWRLLMKTAVVRLSRRLADLAMVTSMACFVILSFLKAQDALDGDSIHRVLVGTGVGLAVIFLLLTAPLVFMFFRRP